MQRRAHGAGVVACATPPVSKGGASGWRHSRATWGRSSGQEGWPDSREPIDLGGNAGWKRSATHASRQRSLSAARKWVAPEVRALAIGHSVSWTGASTTTI